MAFRRVTRYIACFALVALLIWFYFSLLPVNATTVALSMLLLVLATASKWGLGEAIFTSVLCALGFNCFFLPPIGTLTISDPQNWVALGAFLISAVVASQLSAKAKARAEEASTRQRQIERLYELSRAMLMDEATQLTARTLMPIREIFELSHIAFYDCESDELVTEEQGPLSKIQLADVAATNGFLRENGCVILPVRVGTRVVGSLGLAGKELTEPERDSIANLVGISYERTRALTRASIAEAARRGEKLKTFLLDGIAHDLKTPLTSIKTCVTTLITIPPSTDEKRSELLSIIDEETEHLQRTINEAIQLASIESEKVTLQRQRFSIAPLLESVADKFEDPDRISVDVPSDLTVQADPELLGQAVRQLLENAHNYSPHNKPIEIAAAGDSTGVTVRVMDHGPGISPLELDRIFEKFFRGTRGRRNKEGTGMGLAIAKGIVEAHGGRIWAENRPGGGALFVFRLPAA